MLTGCVGSPQYYRLSTASVPAGHATRLVLHDVNGDVEMRAAAGETISVQARIRMHDLNSLEAAHVVAVRNGSDVMIGSTCPTRAFSFDFCEVDYTIVYPRSLALSIKTVNGDVAVDAPASETRVETTNGDVRVREALANVTATSHQGDVTTSLADAWKGGTVTLHTTFGDVRLTVPDDFHGTVHGHTVAGDVDGLTSFGAGPAIADLSTTFGDVQVQRR